ncbi:MAG: putative toxin-antitoxin system toxin component, PIN family [Bacteroidia bacterium]
MNKARAILDTNIWVSFAIGKNLNQLENILLNPEIEIITCTDTVKEFLNVVERPKLQKYLKSERVEATKDLIFQFTTLYRPQTKVSDARDPNDNYLLAASTELKAQFLVTGDEDLLVLNPYHGTKVLRFADFVETIKGK